MRVLSLFLLWQLAIRYVHVFPVSWMTQICNIGLMAKIMAALTFRILKATH